MADPAQSGLSASCDVGVVFALSLEAGCLEDRMSGLLAVKGPPMRVRRGTIDGRQVVLVVGGPGRDAAARATEVLISAHQPRLVIAAGLAGGLVGELARNALILADGVTDEQDKTLSLELSLARRLVDLASIHVGRVLTVNRVVTQAAEKQSLGQRYGAIAVDMESIGVAEVCQRRETACLVVRAISDAMGEELPADIERLLRPTTLVRRLGAVTGTFFRRPSSVKDLWKLKEAALLASDRLAQFLAQFIGRLPR